MVRDNRRIAAPENCLSPDTFKEPKEINTIIHEGLRIDGRNESSLKSIALEVGIVPAVNGSAYLESGKTKVICSVNGPRDVLTKSESSVKGQLYCEFKYAMFSCKRRQPYVPTDEELSISKCIQNALEPVILLHKFPKSRLDIFVVILEDDGGAVPAAITCAGAALSNAGVEMYDLPVGCSLVHCNSQFFIDPTAEEELYCKSKEECAKIASAMMVEYKNQVIYMDSSGCVNRDLLSKSMKILQASCQQILTDIRQCLKQHITQLNATPEEDTIEGSITESQDTQLKLLQPQKYFSTFLENQIRPDSRDLKEFRPILINVGSIGTTNGSALVRLGKTSVICGIKAELANPSPKEPAKGYFVPNVTLTPICSNRYSPGPPTEQAQVYSQIIMDLWRSSAFVDPEELCVTPGQLSWCIFAEMVCLSYDGNILDSCVLALMAALRNTKLPEVVINPDTNAIEVKENVKGLKIAKNLFSASFAVLGDNAIADPTSDEEALAISVVTVFLENSQMISVHTLGCLKEEQLLQCIERSKERYGEVKELIDNFN